MMSDVATRTDSDILRDIRAEIYRQADEGYETRDMYDVMKIVPWSRRQF